MTKLISTPLFRTVLIASCMITGDVPYDVPYGMPHVPPRSESPLPTPTSMKVSSDSRPRRSKSSTKKKFRSVVDSGATVHCIRDKSLLPT